MQNNQIASAWKSLRNRFIKESDSAVAVVDAPAPSMSPAMHQTGHAFDIEQGNLAVDIPGDASSIQNSQVFRNGTVSIADIAVHVSDPEGTGSFATLVIPRDPRLKVVIDGEPNVGRVMVHEGQSIQLELQEVAPLSDWSLSTSKDCLAVIARVDALPGQRSRVKTLTEVRHAVLEVESDEVLPSRPTPEEIVSRLTRDGYRGAFDTEAIEQLCSEGDVAETVVLRGVPVTPGQPPRYIRVELPTVFDPLRRRMALSTVSVGTTIAIVDPGIPGIPGCDVYGRDIPVPKSTALPRLGEGVTELSGRIVSVRDGRPMFATDRVDVLPELFIPHDLTAKDGRVEFDGDVFITGSVMDGCFVKAAGAIRVHGAVMQSTLMGEQGVFVGGTVIGSQLVAGQSKFVYKKLLPLFRTLRVQLDRFHTEYKQLLQHVEKEGHPEYSPEVARRRVADILLSKRHVTLDESLHKVCEDEDFVAESDDRYRALVALLKMRWMGLARTGILPQDVETLHRMADELLAHMESVVAADAHPIRAGGATSSALRASGNIAITRHGVYVSTLESGNQMVVKGPVRGGFLTAENAVRVDELGTPAGSESSVKVSSMRGVIAIRIRHPNTVLQVGRRRDRNQETQTSVVYRG